MMISTRPNSLINAISVAALVVSAALISTPVSAQNVYKWIDGKGLTHYGEQPPAGVKAEKVSSYSKSTSTSTPVAPDSAASDTDAKTATKASPELTPEQRKRKQERCTEEQNRLSALQTNGRIRMALPEGGFKFLSEEEVAAEVETTKAVIDQSCD